MSWRRGVPAFAPKTEAHLKPWRVKLVGNFADELATAPDADLVGDRNEMLLHRIGRNPESGSNPLGRQSLQQAPHHFALACAETIGLHDRAGATPGNPVLSTMTAICLRPSPETRQPCRVNQRPDRVRTSARAEALAPSKSPARRAFAATAWTA